MKLRILILSAFFAFMSCNDNNKQQEEVEILTETEAEIVGEGEINMENENVVVAVEGNPELSTFALALNSAEVIENFVETEGPYTIFAPSNFAFSRMNSEARDLYMGTDSETFVNYLVIQALLTTDILKEQIRNANGEYILNTMQGEDIVATIVDNEIVLTDVIGNTATIVEADINAGNGVVHVIDYAIMPLEPEMTVGY